MMRLTIPESKSEIKLGDFQKYQTIDSKDERFLGLKMIEIFCGVSFREVNKMKLVDVSDTLEILNKAFESKSRFKRRFKIGDKEFGFISDLESISMGEYIDISNYLGESENLHKLMSVMYRPITSQTRDLYEIEDYEGSEKYADTLKGMPLDVCLEASVFFYHLAKDLLNAMEHSSRPEIVKVMDLVRKNLLVKDGDGTAQYMELQTATF